MCINISLLAAFLSCLGVQLAAGQLSVEQSSTTQSQVMDASDVTWAHAVNSRLKLEEQLAGSVDFLEADVSLGHVIGKPTGLSLPIMAHPPEIISDISLETWLDIVITRSTNKGIKLDFKSIETVEPSLQILQHHGEEVKVPLWLNADIIPGPISAQAKPVDASRFLTLCLQYFPNATLSVGWTTLWIPTISPDSWSYDWSYVRAMVDTLRCAGIEQNTELKLTFPVRAIFASRSIPQLQWLLRTFPHSTLTVWSAQIDAVAVKDILKLRKSFHISRVYYDVPEPLNTQFQGSKNDVPKLVSDDVSSNNKWWTLSQDKSNISCLTTAYADNSAIVFASGPTSAALLKDSFQVSDGKRLTAQGVVRFVPSSKLDEMLKEPEVYEVVFALMDVSLFKKTEVTQDEDDTDVVWNALNTSRLHTFQQGSSDSFLCYYFKLDTSEEDSMFQVWKLPWYNFLFDEYSEEDLIKHGQPQIGKNTRLVLPSGPFMLGFLSSGKVQVVVHDLSVTGNVNPVPGTSFSSAAALCITPVIIQVLMTLVSILL